MIGPRQVRLAVIVAPLALLAAARAAAGQQDAPAEVVRQAFAALSDGRWSDVPAYVDSVALVEFRRQQLQRVWAMDRSTARPRHVNPDLPACVAEYYERQEQRAAPPALRRQSLLGAASVEELERLTPAQMLTRWLEMRADGAARAPADSAAPRPARRHEERTVVGAVQEDDSTAYVVYRVRTYFGPVSTLPENANLLRLVRRHGQWKLASPEPLLTSSGGVVVNGIVGSTGFVQLRPVRP